MAWDNTQSSILIWGLNLYWVLIFLRKCLSMQKEHFHAKNITYRQMALEDICQIDEQFDLITSSLAFDYAEDLDKLNEKYIWSIKIWCPFCI